MSLFVQAEHFGVQQANVSFSLQRKRKRMQSFMFLCLCCIIERLHKKSIQVCLISLMLVFMLICLHCSIRTRLIIWPNTNLIFLNLLINNFAR